MRNHVVVTAAFGVILSSLAACGGSPPPPPAAPAAPTPVVVAYASDAKPMVAKKQVFHGPNAGLCFDVKGDDAAQHAPVRLSKCQGKENQRWDFGPGTNGFVQVGGIGGLCVTLTSAPGADGTQLELLTCNGTPAQQFRFNVDGRIQEGVAKSCLTQGPVAPTGALAPIVPTACDAANASQVFAVAGQ